MHMSFCWFCHVQAQLHDDKASTGNFRNGFVASRYINSLLDFRLWFASTINVAAPSASLLLFNNLLSRVTFL